MMFRVYSPSHSPLAAWPVLVIPLQGDALRRVVAGETGRFTILAFDQEGRRLRSGGAMFMCQPGMSFSTVL